MVQALKSLDAFAVENPVGPGTPDINFIGGWIECKWLRAWPKRVETPVTLDHPVTPSQKVWLKRRIRRGGKAWVMLQCGREWLLFRGDVAADFLGISTRDELYKRAYRVWKTGLNVDDLITVFEITRPDRRLTDGELREQRWKALGGSW